MRRATAISWPTRRVPSLARRPWPARRISTAAAPSLEAAAGDAVAAAASLGVVPQALAYAHVATGLPWWLAIGGSAVALRVAILPSVFLQVRESRRFVVAVALSVASIPIIADPTLGWIGFLPALVCLSLGAMVFLVLRKTSLLAAAASTAGLAALALGLLYLNLQGSLAASAPCSAPSSAPSCSPSRTISGGTTASPAEVALSSSARSKIRLSSCEIAVDSAIFTEYLPSEVTRSEVGLR